MTNPKALNDLSLLMVEALRPLTTDERETVLARLAGQYCLGCGYEVEVFTRCPCKAE